MTDYDGIYEPSNQTHQLSLQAFFFLLILISRKEHIIISSSFIVKLSTELPIGEGLGSSASFAVCLAACFWRWSLLQKGTVLYEFGKQDLLKISNYAQNCDSIIYNSSTKIDTIISTYGMIKIFDKGIINTLTSKSFSNLPDMKILLVFSNVKKTKSKKSMKIEALKNSHLLIDFILNSIEVISSTFIYVLDIIDVKIYNRLKKNNSQFINITDNYKTLLDIIHMNQGLLKTLGMSHPNLDIICAIARNFGFAGKLASKSGVTLQDLIDMNQGLLRAIAQDFSLGGKIAASSGGRYAFIFLLSNNSDELVQDLIEIFESYNFSAKIVSLNCSGVRVE
ncbi:Mevalonate kinase [Atta colombica]|uniref:mevalonate kinase n=1 Tax=Atta colombica TaxID=520822 RepID=A0A151I4N9_9HYME|nr:Mevalonate kinase [Atta colombica]